MKKIFALAIISFISLFAVTAGFADEGETSEASGVAPAIIQAPSVPPEAQTICPAAVPSASDRQPLPEQSYAAQSGVRTIREANLRTADSLALEGSVVCVAPSGLMQPKSKVVVAAADGEETEFTMKVLGVVYDSQGTILSVDQLNPGEKVLVNYKDLGCSKKEAISIKVLK